MSKSIKRTSMKLLLLASACRRAGSMVLSLLSGGWESRRLPHSELPNNWEQRPAVAATPWGGVLPKETPTSVSLIP